MRKLAVLLLMILTVAGTAAAYVRITLTTGFSPKWLVTPVEFWISERGSSQIGNGTEFLAVRGAFQTWQDVSSANISFNYRGTTKVSAVGRDGANLITFSDDTTPLGATTIAATFTFFSSFNGIPTIAEADIYLNPALQWT